jgi:hypothetical protein
MFQQERFCTRLQTADKEFYGGLSSVMIADRDCHVFNMMGPQGCRYSLVTLEGWLTPLSNYF